MTLRKKMVTLFVGLSLVGCYAGGEDVDVGEIGEALELDNGGFDLEDELPAFGLPDTFEDLGLLEEDPALVDEMETDSEVAALMAAPDAVQYNVAINWGQIPGDPTNRDARDWSGVLVVNRGAMVVRRAIMFEGPTDHVLPRRDRQAVAFTSWTLPHHDGLLLTVIDPDPGATEPLTLTYVADLPGPLGSEGGALRVPVRALLDGPRELAADDAGNRMVAAAMARPLDVCGQGFIMGRWHRVAEGRGRFMGRVVGAGGELKGHIRGIYGVRASGEKVFFGKYINADGEFRGIFAGHYGEGRFAGRWITRAGEHGVLGGAYRESIPGPETGGHFIGRYAETSCDVRL